MSKNKIVDPGQRIETLPFRVSYPHILKPEPFNPEKPKYSITMLFPKTKKNGEPIDYSGMKNALKLAKISEYGANPNLWPKNLESPISNGDSDGYADKEGYAGHWVVKATNLNKPILIDRNDNEIKDQRDFYPGCYARAKMFSRAWEFAGKKGIQFIVDDIQKIAEGKPLGGGGTATRGKFTPLTASADYDDESSEPEEYDETDSFN